MLFVVVDLLFMYFPLFVGVLCLSLGGGAGGQPPVIL